MRPEGRPRAVATTRLSRLVGGQEIVGSNPTVLTDNRAEVQMEARLLWEQEGLGSTPRCPTQTR